MKTIIIQGSSNPAGNSAKITQELQARITSEKLDLTTLQIMPFDYEFNNQDDDFNKTMHRLLDTYDTFIFLTPVYWYTMSGIMKNFVDRFTDGLIHDQALGRKFEGKQMAAVACGSGPENIEGYFIPFQKTATYLKMNYIGDVHLWIGSDSAREIHPLAQRRINSFIQLFQ